MTYATTLGPNNVNLVVLNESDKVDLRRWCGYGSAGFGTTGFYEMDRYLPVYQTFEFKLNAISVAEWDRVVGMFMPNLRQLETDLFNLRNLVLVDKAAVFTRNKSEAAERHNEYRWWRLELCNFLNVSAGPLMGNGSNTMRIRI